MTAPPLPEGLSAVRVSSGTAVVVREDGRPVGKVLLPPGWYFTEAGHARLWSAVDVWQTRLETVERQLSALKSSAASPPHRCPDPPSHDAASFATATVCLGLGFIIGRAFPRRPRGEP